MALVEQQRNSFRCSEQYLTKKVNEQRMKKSSGADDVDMNYY